MSAADDDVELCPRLRALRVAACALGGLALVSGAWEASGRPSLRSPGPRIFPVDERAPALHRSAFERLPHACTPCGGHAQPTPIPARG